jgi:DNA-binding NtrC family response regulator
MTACITRPDHEEEPLIVDPEMRRTYDLLTQVAQTDLPVLLLGETGSGKEGAAQWLHARSGRPAHRFVTINCAALSESVIESELFGHERGAFTGALGVREGLFEVAHGGTLLLDEVGEFSPRAQAKLLRVLETGEVVRVGSHQPRKVDVRVVAATHRDLPTLVQQGTFREDLYFRLSGLTLTIAPLRNRPSEIVPLANLFLRRLARGMGRPVWLLADDAIAALLRHAWPGNVRELRNVVTRAATLCSGATLCADQLALGVRPPASAPPVSDLASSGVRREVRAFEKERILAALEKTDGNQTRAAVLLGLSRRTLTNKLNAYDIERPRKRAITREAAE